jgi:CopA family copper-resistance protein
MAPVMRRFYFIILLFIFTDRLIAQQTVQYDLYVNDTLVNYTGKNAKAIVINGHIPGPTLYFTEGDTAEVIVHNQMNIETSIHWHGIILPNDQDGVPYLTTAPIHAHTTYRYKFPIVQSGTYWYHAHTQLQEQSGLYGALVIHKRKELPIREYTLLLSDWTNYNPLQIQRNLKMANDWYAIKKHATQNWGEALLNGHFGTKVRNEWLRMLPMDVSDVYYDSFLSNGQPEQSMMDLRAGDSIRVRIINGSSSTYFWVQFAGGKMKVVASDGSDVVPVSIDRMIIGVAETYDVIVKIPEDMSYELKATAEDRTKSTSLWLGDGMKMKAPVLQELKYFEGMKMMNSMMKFNGRMDDMGMKMSNQTMDMNMVMYPEITGEEKKKQNKRESGNADIQHMHDQGTVETVEIVTLNYAMLRSPGKTVLPEVPFTTLTFNLTGNMNRYQWSINDRVVSDTDKILIRKGENVRIILRNESMMRHPMHLHGHYFRVLNGSGAYAPLKNVLDIMPMETDTIEFNAPYEGDWFFHCHILYHMMSGMGRVFSVPVSKPNIQIDTIKNAYRKFLKDDRMWHLGGSLALQSNMSEGKLMLMNRNYHFDFMGSADYSGNYMTETHFARYIDRMQWLRVYLGTDIRDMDGIHSGNHPESGTNSSEYRQVVTAGVQYLLPFFLLADLRIDHTGNVRFQVSRNDLALSSRLRLDAMWNTDMEWEVGLRYIITKNFSVSASYDNDYGAGGGLTLTY